MTDIKQQLLLCYKGNISALVLFAQQQNGSICFPEALPPLSSPLDIKPNLSGVVTPHPAMLLNQVVKLLALPTDCLRLEPGFSEYIEVPGETIHFSLARFTALDPPHQLLQSRHCWLRTLPELRNTPPTELELLRRAYVRLMED